MDKFTRFYSEIIDLICHYGEQHFIPEEEVDNLINAVNEIKEKIESEN